MSYLKSEMELLDFAATLRVHMKYERNIYNSLREKYSEIKTTNPCDPEYYVAQSYLDKAFTSEYILSELESLCDDFMSMLTDEGQKAVSERFTRVDNFLKKEGINS